MTKSEQLRDKIRTSQQKCWLGQNVQLCTMGSQKITMPQLLHNATWQSDHHAQQCQLQKVSQSHQAIVRQHMCAKWKQQPDVDRGLAAQSDQIQDSTMGSVPQIRQQWHGQTITEQSRGVTAYRSIKQFIRIHPRCRKSHENPTKAYQKTEVLNQNPMKIPSEPIRKERICQNLTEAFGEELGFSIYYCKADPPLKKT